MYDLIQALECPPLGGGTPNLQEIKSLVGLVDPEEDWTRAHHCYRRAFAECGVDVKKITKTNDARWIVEGAVEEPKAILNVFAVVTSTNTAVVLEPCGIEHGRFHYKFHFQSRYGMPGSLNFITGQADPSDTSAPLTPVADVIVSPA